MPRILMTRSIQFANRPLDERETYSVTHDELKELATYDCCTLIADAPPPPASEREAATALPETETAAVPQTRSRRVKSTPAIPAIG